MNSFFLILLISMPTPFGDMIYDMEQIPATSFPTMEECVKQGESVMEKVPDISYVCVPETMVIDKAPEAKSMVI